MAGKRHNDRVKHGPSRWFTNTKSAAVAKGCVRLARNHSEPRTHTDARHMAASNAGRAAAKGPHESTGAHKTGVWTWGSMLNLGDVILCPLPPMLLAQLVLQSCLSSLSSKLISFKGCLGQGQITYIQLDRRARRKQDQWPTWIRSREKTGENETI